VFVFNVSHPIDRICATDSSFTTPKEHTMSTTTLLGITAAAMALSIAAVIMDAAAKAPH